MHDDDDVTVLLFVCVFFMMMSAAFSSLPFLWYISNIGISLGSYRIFIQDMGSIEKANSSITIQSD